MITRLLLSTLLGCLAAGCISSSAERGVPVTWTSVDDLEVGTTTRSDVLDRLGPPSQILTSQRGSAFYYLLERTDISGLILLVYNTRTERTDYDRAVFFFDEAGVLQDWSTSEAEGD